MFKKSLIKSFLPAVLIFAVSCNHPLWLSHKLNEAGIKKYKGGRYGEARSLFEKSAAYKFRENIPLYNLANNYYLEKDYPTAHKYFEKAISVKANFPEAFYNDGCALYDWGRGELDKNFCKIKRTLLLWEKSIGRFRRVIDMKGLRSSIGTEAELNINYIREQMDFIKIKNEENRELCRKNRSENKNEKDKNKKRRTDKPSRGKEKEPVQRNKKSGEENKPVRLTADERESIKKALMRIKKDSGNNSFLQAKSQQIRGKEVREKEGMNISW